MDHFAGVGRYALQDHVELRVTRQIILNNIEQLSLLETASLIRVRRLAQFTLEVLPEVGRDNLRLLYDSPLLKPHFQTLVMDKTHTAGALAGSQQRIVIALLLCKANAADRLLLRVQLFTKRLVVGSFGIGRFGLFKLLGQVGLGGCQLRRLVYVARYGFDVGICVLLVVELLLSRPG